MSTPMRAESCHHVKEYASSCILVIYTNIGKSCKLRFLFAISVNSESMKPSVVMRGCNTDLRPNIPFDGCFDLTKDGVRINRQIHTTYSSSKYIHVQEKGTLEVCSSDGCNGDRQEIQTRALLQREIRRIYAGSRANTGVTTGRLRR